MNTILIVEDNLQLLELASTYLKKNGFEILSSPDGLEAMKIAQNKKIDLIITDIMMPMMSGKELVVKIKEIHPDIKVLYASGYISEAIKRDAINYDYIEKPFDYSQLLDKVRTLLR